MYNTNSTSISKHLQRKTYFHPHSGGSAAWFFSPIPEYFPNPSAVRLVEVSHSDFSEAAAGSSILLGIITSGTGTLKQKKSTLHSPRELLSLSQYHVANQNNQ